MVLIKRIMRISIMEIAGFGDDSFVPSFFEGSYTKIKSCRDGKTGIISMNRKKCRRDFLW